VILPPGTKANMLDVKITPTTLKVAYKNKPN
jgi:hypothetical protein